MANPKVEAAYFWVQYGPQGDKKFVKGGDFKNLAVGTEVVWVQRGTDGTDKYWAWYGQPEDVGNPDFSYRFNYFVQGYNEGLPGDQRSQPDQDGQINFSLYFEAPGPYPTNEWRNIRNDKAGGSVQDLDGKTLVLKNNTEIEDGDICRITSGGMVNWYVFDTPDSNNFIKFKTIYTREDGRERVDVKRKGNRPAPDGTQEVVISIYKKSKLKPYNKIRDTDWLWAQTTELDGSIKKWKVNGKEFKALFVDIQPNFEVLSGNVYLNMHFANTSTTVKVVKAENSQEYHYRGTYTNHRLPVGNYFVPTLEGGGLQCIKLQGTANDGNFDFKSNFDMSTVTNMTYFARCCGLFNGDISHFNLQNVSCAYMAFDNCRNFNASVGGGFNMANATNVTRMFANCHKFNKPINDFKFPKADRVENTWYNCNALNQNISGIEYKDGALLRQTWSNCQAMNHPDLAEKFPFPACIRLYGATRDWRGFRQSVANWTQPISYEMSGLFWGWTQFNQDVGHFNTSNVKCMHHTFSSANSFNHPSVRNWDTSRCHNFTYAFHSADIFDVELDTWNVSNAINIAGMFQGAKNIGKSNGGYYNLESWDTSNVTDMGASLFWKTSLVKGISTWNTSKVRDMKGIFANSIVSDDLSGWDVSNVVQMSNLCCQWGQREADKVALTGDNVFCMNFEDWNTKSVEWFQYAFFDAKLSQPLYLHGWRMPKMKDLWRDPNNSSNIANPYVGWVGSTGNETDQTYQWNPQIMTGFSKNLPVLEAGVYEPDLTLVGSHKRVSSYNTENIGPYFGISNSGDKVTVRFTSGDYRDLNYSYENRHIEIGGSSGSGYYTMDFFFNQNVQPRITAVGGTSSSNTFQRGWQVAPRVGFNKHLLNKPRRSFQISGHAADVFGIDQANQSTYGLEHLDTSLLTNTQNMFVEFPFCGSYVAGSPRKQYLDISTWDVSNVTCMKNMFMGNNSSRDTVPAHKDWLEMGDLRGWCVQHITDKPPNWNSKLTEADPCWGECPLPGELGTCSGGGSEDKPMPPGGNWLYEDQQYWITIEENAGRFDSYYINFGSTCQLWRATRGTQDFSKRSNSSSIYLDKSYDWIITSRGNDQRILFATEADWVFLGADIANVKSMFSLFQDAKYFNDDISWWDTSRVTCMRNMFRNARDFNQDLSTWDVSNVTCSLYFDRGATSWDDSYKPNFP